MNRKYRVWDEIDKLWIPPGYLMMNPEGKIFTSLHEDGDLYLEESIPHKICFFTGLKDKNGKEVYEGDIVKTNEDWDTYGFQAGEINEVYFNYGGFRLKPKNITKNAKGYWIEDGEDFEIIGNIYENPELLDKP